jgi:hypothetical protein
LVGQRWIDHHIVMTGRERLALLRAAEKELKLTGQGYIQWSKDKKGGHWDRALASLERLERDLLPGVHDLGPIIKGGKSILLHDCTHITGGLGWPAFDDAPTFTKADAGHPVIAPENCVVYDNTSSAQGGDAFYIRGDSGLKYWVGHIASVPRLNQRFRKGQIMTSISGAHPRPHCHLGIDARPVLSHHLVSHTNYTHGAPKIGVQLGVASV